VSNSLGMNSVVVDRTYFAASGRECRRLRNSAGAPIQRVACKAANGQWQFARDLQPVSTLLIPDSTQAFSNTTDESAVALPLVPSAGSTLMLNQGSVDNVIESNDAASFVVELGSVDEQVVVDQTYKVEHVSDNVSVSSDAPDMIQRELYANETLWSFAKRTTGNALNWKTIAEINNITDAKTLAPGAQLNIPVALAGEGG